MAQRMTAVSMACLASAGLIMSSLAGFSCSFVTLRAVPSRDLMTSMGEIFVGEELAYIGVQCEESPFFDDSDRMWRLSQIFLYISLALGGLTTIVAWALSTVVHPTNHNWRFMSMAASATAVMEVPVFLLFETEVCNMDLNRQSCGLGIGSYFNIASIVLWVIMTLWSQCLNPPRWGKEIEAWRARGVDVKEITIPSGDENNTARSSSNEGPKDFNGDLYVTSNNDGMAVWKVGEVHNANDEDWVSEVSSISADGAKDVEAPKPTAQQVGPGPKSILRSKSVGTQKTAPSRPIENHAPTQRQVPTSAQSLSTLSKNGEPDDSDIRKGASIVIESLRQQAQYLQDQVKSYRFPTLDISTRGGGASKAETSVPSVSEPTSKPAPQPEKVPPVSDQTMKTSSFSPNSKGTAPSTEADKTASLSEQDGPHRQAMRENALIDDNTSDDSYANTGIKVTIICPDGTKESAQFNSCFSSYNQGMEKQGEQPANIKKESDKQPKEIEPAPSPLEAPPIESVRTSSMKSKRSQRSQKSKKAPIETVTLEIPPDDDDGVSEMTNAIQSESTRSRQDPDFADPQSILKDLERTY